MRNDRRWRDGGWGPVRVRSGSMMRVESRDGRMEKGKGVRPLYWADNIGAGTSNGLVVIWNKWNKTSSVRHFEMNTALGHHVAVEDIEEERGHRRHLGAFIWTSQQLHPVG